MVVGAREDWYVYQMDIKNAFLHGDLLEDVYIKIPTGYQGPGKPVVVGQGDHPYAYHNPHKVCKLIKSLHGLKQAPRQWFAKPPRALKTYGFGQYKAAYSLFTKLRGNQFVAV